MNGEISVLTKLVQDTHLHVMLKNLFKIRIIRVKLGIEKKKTLVNMIFMSNL